MDQTSALVLFSGGQDSAVCLAWALSRYNRVETIGFDYGQRHSVELSCRKTLLTKIRAAFPDWAVKLGDDHLLALPTLGQISDSSLTRDRAIEMDSAGLPNTFVPGRNLLFFTYAAALGYRRGLFTLVGGMCETDFSGYPDCRRDTLDALQKSLTLGMDASFTIETPLMQIDKAATWAMAQDLGERARAGGGTALVETIVEHSHSCYLGERASRFEWGYGCGTCPACELRAKGWHEWRSRAG